MKILQEDLHRRMRTRLQHIIKISRKNLAKLQQKDDITAITQNAAKMESNKCSV